MSWTTVWKFLASRALKGDHEVRSDRAKVMTPAQADSNPGEVPSIGGKMTGGQQMGGGGVQSSLGQRGEGQPQNSWAGISERHTPQGNGAQYAQYGSGGEEPQDLNLSSRSPAGQEGTMVHGIHEKGTSARTLTGPALLGSGAGMQLLKGSSYDSAQNKSTASRKRSSRHFTGGGNASGWLRWRRLERACQLPIPRHV